VFVDTYQTVRRVALRIVLAAMAFATVATSAPVSPSITATRTVLVEAPDLLHFTVVGNAIAADHADDFVLAIFAFDGQDVRVVPDNPALDIRVAASSANWWEGIADACQPTGPCEIGFTLELVDDTGEPLAQGAATVEIDARFERDPDPSFFLPEDRSFPEGSTLEIRLDAR